MPKLFNVEFADLAVGQTFESEGVFQGVTDSKCLWTVVERGDQHVTLCCTYWGVEMARLKFDLTAPNEEGKRRLEYEELPC